MSELRIITTAREFHSIEELSDADRNLVTAARKIALTAYAPYSKFRVGAAILLANGEIVASSNIENAAFPSGICAERSAISSASSRFPGVKPLAIAIAALTTDGLTVDPVPPCGNCRQMIAEEEQRYSTNVKVIISGENRFIILEKGGDLLPLQFNRSNLG